MAILWTSVFNVLFLFSIVLLLFLYRRLFSKNCTPPIIIHSCAPIQTPLLYSLQACSSIEQIRHSIDVDIVFHFYFRHYSACFFFVGNGHIFERNIFAFCLDGFHF